MLPLVTAGFLRHFPHCLLQAVMLALFNYPYKGITNHLMQQHRHSSHLCPSCLTWLCTPMLLLAALLAIPTGEPVNSRPGQFSSSSCPFPLRICQALLTSPTTIQQVDVFSGARSELLPGIASSADSPGAGTYPLFSQTTASLQANTAAILCAETLPPSPHSAAHPAVFFALSPPL